MFTEAIVDSETLALICLLPEMKPFEFKSNEHSDKIVNRLINLLDKLGTIEEVYTADISDPGCMKLNAIIETYQSPLIKEYMKDGEEPLVVVSMDYTDNTRKGYILFNNHRVYTFSKPR